MATRHAWRQIGSPPSLIHMPYVPVMPPPRALRFVLSLLATVSLPVVASAQSQWTGIGAIRETVMFMDTTTIVRAGTIRKVWIKSLDSSPMKLVAGKDTLTFDVVLGLNVFDCSNGTRTVTAVQYLLGEDVVFDVPETHDKPVALRPNSFFHAVYTGLCQAAR